MPMAKKAMMAGFNKWLDESIKNPEAFEQDPEINERHLLEREEGREPTYGKQCVEILTRYAAGKD